MTAALGYASDAPSRHAIDAIPGAALLEFGTDWSVFCFSKYLKALRWKTLYQSIVDAWQKNPATFKIDPRHLIPETHT